MHRLAARTVTVVSLAALLASASFPALAKSPHPERRGGKKAIGEIVSFDAATAALVVELTGGEELTASVDPEAQVKLEHRGRHRKSKGHGNPSAGSLDDLVAGAQVLRLKFEDELVTKIRLRPAPATTLPDLPTEGDSTDDAADAAPGDDSAEGTDDVEEETEDQEDADTPDDDDSGDVEDALPPLPVTLP